MTYVRAYRRRENSLIGIRKPLLYPSELRGHGPGTFVDCFDLRKRPHAIARLRGDRLLQDLLQVAPLSPRASNFSLREQRFGVSGDLFQHPGLDRKFSFDSPRIRRTLGGHQPDRNKHVAN